MGGRISLVFVGHGMPGINLLYIEVDRGVGSFGEVQCLVLKITGTGHLTGLEHLF